MNISFFILIGILLQGIASPSAAREVHFDEPQLYYEAFFEGGLSLMINYSHRSLRHEGQGLTHFPTQSVDNKVSTWLHGGQHTPYYTNREHHHHLVSDHIQDFVRYTSLLSPLMKPSGHKLGAWLTMIHANNIWHLITYTLKFSVERQRPKYYFTRDPSASNTHSFPSGHTGRTFVMAFITDKLFDMPPWSRVALYTLAGSVGLLRITSDRHFFSDVIAAVGIAYFSASLSCYLFEPPYSETVKSGLSFGLGPNQFSISYLF